MHDQHARGQVSGGSAEVDQRFARAGSVPVGNAHGADLHFERGGDAVHGFERVVFGRLAVRVEVDETRGDCEAPRINDAAAIERARTDGGDFARSDGDGANGVEPGGGVEDATVADDEVIRLCGSSHREKKGEKKPHPGLLVI